MFHEECVVWLRIRTLVGIIAVTLVLKPHNFVLNVYMYIYI